MVKFTLNFAVDSEGGSDAYDALIKDIREKLAVGESIEGVPILAQQVPGQLEFFDVNLSYTDRGETVTLQARFRTDNLYLVRYRRWSADDSHTWHELEGLENYNDLTAAAGLELDAIPLSSSHIGAAITTLAGSKTTLRQRARALLTLIFAIAEAARFRDISSLVSSSWWGESTPGVQFANRVRSWARLSSAVQRTRNEGHNFRDDFDGESTDIWSFVVAIRALGIMLAYRASRLMCSIHGIAAGASHSAFAQGQPLLEVFYVRIRSIDGEAPGQLFGSVTVTDSAREHSIWARDQDNHVDVYEGDNILLEGPSGLWALSAADEFYIKLDLWDYDPVSPGSIASGTIAFNPRDSVTKYDVVHNREVSGKDGSVTVGYVAIADGLYAQITVILIDGDGKNTADVYGEMTAKNGHGQSELFRRTNKQYVGVKPKGEIPLSRTIIAVPTTGTLRVDANLWDHDATSGDDEIAFGSVEFRPLYKRSEKKAITGEYGKVEVRVTWK